MVLGRTESSIRKLNQLFKEGKVDKNVLLIVYNANLVPRTIETETWISIVHSKRHDLPRPHPLHRRIKRNKRPLQENHPRNRKTNNNTTTR